MPLNSMTGFSRTAERHSGSFSWVWEIKSVNGKNLDLRCRLPAGLEGWEQKLRQLAGAKLGRGNLQVSLTLNRQQGGTTVQVNQEVLGQIISTLNDLALSVEAERPRLDGILSIKGVLDVVETPTDEDELAARDQALESSFQEALDRLAAMRAEEGKKLEGMITEQLDRVEALAGQAAETADQQPAALQARFTEQLDQLLGGAKPVPEDRLAHEVALLATKADVTEELDRLSAHVSAARDLVALKEPVGRRLDFLTQELNRETNTICSKSSSLELTRIGLDLKAVVDQIREQVQNVE